MKLNEARNLKVGDVVYHKFLGTYWGVVEARKFKSNPARFSHKLAIGYRKHTFTEKGLHLWTINSSKK